MKRMYKKIAIVSFKALQERFPVFEKEEVLHGIGWEMADYGDGSGSQREIELGEFIKLVERLQALTHEEMEKIIPLLRLLPVLFYPQFS